MALKSDFGDYGQSEDDTSPMRGQRRRIVQYVGAVVWPSFLVACVASMVLFAAIDPSQVSLQIWHLPISRELGYTIGFFCLWLTTAATSLMTGWLIYGHQEMIERHQKK